MSLFIFKRSSLMRRQEYFQFLQILKMLGNICRKDGTNHKFLHFLGIFRFLKNIQFKVFKESEEMFDVHFLQDGFIVCLDG